MLFLVIRFRDWFFVAASNITTVQCSKPWYPCHDPWQVTNKPCQDLGKDSMTMQDRAEGSHDSP